MCCLLAGSGDNRQRGSIEIGAMKHFLTIGTAILALLSFGGAWAEGSLKGHLVHFYVLTYDDPSRPHFAGRGQTVRVDDGVEFVLDREGAQNDLDVIPVIVNISANRIELSFEQSEPDFLVEAIFNGYVLEFVTNCALITQAALDRNATTMPLAEDAVQIIDRGLRINAQGMAVTPEGRIAIDVKAEDCPMS